MTISGKKIVVTKLSPGINKAHVVFRKQFDKEIAEKKSSAIAADKIKDMTDDKKKSAAFKEIYETLYDKLLAKYYEDQFKILAKKILVEFGISLRPRYFIKPATIVNRGYENKYKKNGIEIYFSSSRDLNTFLRGADKLEDYDFSLPPGGKIEAYLMRTFVMPLFTWYSIKNWRRVQKKDTIANTEVEVSVRIKDCIPLLENDHTVHKPKIIVTSLDNEMLNKCIRISDVIDLMADKENIITNVVLHSFLLEPPNSFTHLQSVNIMLSPKSNEIGFMQNGVPVKNIFVSSERELIENYSLVMHYLRPDIVVGHNSIRFDFPVLALAQMRVNKAKLFNLVSCIHLKSAGDYNRHFDKGEVDTFKIEQGSALIGPKSTISGTLLHDTMLICLTYFRIKKTAISLDNCAAKLNLQLKHGMTYQSLKEIYSLTIEQLASPLDNDQLLPKLDNILKIMQDEMVFSKKLGEIKSVIDNIRENLNSKRLDAVEALNQLIKMTYEYCSQDTMIVHGIIKSTNFISNHFVFCRAACLSSKLVMENKMYTIINQFKITLGTLHDCLYTNKKASGDECNLRECDNTWGATMLVNKRSSLATHRVLVAFDFEGAYTSTMIAGISPNNCIFTEPTMPGMYTKFYIPNNTCTCVIPVWFKVGESYLGNILKTLTDLRATYKKKMREVFMKDDMLYQQYNSVQLAAKTLGVSLYGITTHGPKESIYNWATSNGITLHTAYCLALFMGIIISEGFVTTSDDIIYAHTDSEFFKPNLQPYFDFEIPDDASSYEKFVKEYHPKIVEIANHMCATANARAKDIYGGYITMKMSVDCIIYGSMFFEQGKYSYANIIDGIKPLSIDTMTYKKLKCTDQSATPLVSGLIKTVVVDLIKHIRQHKPSPGELLEVTLASVNEFTNSFDFTNLDNFVKTKKYKIGVKNTHVIDVATRHNQTVAALGLNIPFIQPGQQINIIYVKYKNNWRVNGLPHTNTTNTTAITQPLYNPEIHEIDLEYYLKSSKADLVSISKSFGFEGIDSEKRVSSILNDIFTKTKKTQEKRSKFFAAWWPGFNALFQYDDYLGLSKYLCTDERKLHDFIVSYLYRLEEVAKDICSDIRIVDCEMACGVSTMSELNNKYNAELKMLTNIIKNELGTLCTKLKHIIKSRIDHVYKFNNPFELFSEVANILSDNEDILKNANDCARRFSMYRFVKKLKHADLSISFKSRMSDIENIKSQYI